jgi:hypothetical protein
MDKHECECGKIYKTRQELIAHCAMWLNCEHKPRAPRYSYVPPGGSLLAAIREGD